MQNLCEAVDADTFKIPRESFKIKSFILQTNTADTKIYLNNETVSYLFQTLTTQQTDGEKYLYNHTNIFIYLQQFIELITLQSISRGDGVQNPVSVVGQAGEYVGHERLPAAVAPGGEAAHLQIVVFRGF